MSVRVGVRVRPFNQRQVDLNCRLCVQMNGPMTRLFDPDDPDKHRDFTFDYSFWSHDQFAVDQSGYLLPDSPKYADQKMVFEQVGLQILSNAWEGYHCCLFAYGQTGSGKSYSMVGYGANKGIVPISCQQIFSRISKNEDKNKEYEINVSMLQIYNERVQDLLIPISKRSKEGFKIREHKTLGIYVEGLSKHYVDTYQAIEQKMDEGSKNRSIAATEMNASSSRAHTIISIEFRQKEVIQGKKRQKLSVIHLVDLAGSEKVGKTGATGDRLKQAAGINKSLSVLGLVISTLADKALGKSKGIVVPYRDSCLTRILQNALGGNSKTLMICAISPATDNYEETLSTLRYADQAKKIQNKAVVNESQTDKIIRNLTAEKQQLREKVQKFEEMFKKLQGMGFEADKLEEFNDAKEQLRFNTMMMNDYAMTKKEKLEHEKQIVQVTDINQVDTSKPHMTNLNQDPQLSRIINYSIDFETCRVGKRNIQPKNNVQIGGMGIRSLHAVITREGGEKSYIQPIFEGEDSGCYLNGQHISQKQEIKNLDRLSFGTNNMFIVIIPEGKPRQEIDDKGIDWEYAQNQLYLRREIIEKEIVEKRQRQIKEESEKQLKIQQEKLQKLQEQLKQEEEARKNIEEKKLVQMADFQKKVREEEYKKLEKQIETKKKQLRDREGLQYTKAREKFDFQKKLLKTLPKCIELNLIAKEFKRNISMNVKMLLPNEREDEQDQDLDLKKRSIKIKVVNREVGYSYWWDVDKLTNRYYIIKDFSDNYFETGVIPELSKNEDPFWDPPEHVLIGRAFLTTKALSYMFDNLTTLSIIGEDDHCGQITVNMIPTDETGERNLCEEMDDEEIQCEPEELIGKPFYYNVVIESASIPDNYENIYVEYMLKTDEKNMESYKTEEIKEKTRKPEFNYKKLHHFENISESILEYLSTAKIIFKIYAYEIIPEERKEKSGIIEPFNIPKQEKASTLTQVSSEKGQTVRKPQNYIISMKQAPQASTIKKGKVQSTNPLPKKKEKKDDKDCVIF